MSKRSNIKWRDKDIKELRRVVKNFNSKIDRVSKDRSDLKDVLPDKESVKTLRNSISTRQEYNRLINSLTRFGRRGAEEKADIKGLNVSKYEVRETQILSRIVNIKRTAERKRLGIEIPTGRLGTAEEQQFRPKKFSTDKTPAEWQELRRSLLKEVDPLYKQKGLEEYKKKYLKAINDFLGKDGEDLYSLVKSIDVNTLFENSISTPTLSIGFTSDPLDNRRIVERALSDWGKVLQT